jgi:hypothetical protein
MRADLGEVGHSHTQANKIMQPNPKAKSATCWWGAVTPQYHSGSEPNQTWQSSVNHTAPL